MRVQVTASRDWDDEAVIRRDLTTVADWHYTGDTMTVAHGDCPTGGDRFTREWCEDLTELYARKGITIVEERYPANWKRHGKRAGLIRNTTMIALKPRICFAYIRPCISPSCKDKSLHGSHGATHCSDLAKASGIRVVYRRRGYVVSR